MTAAEVLPILSPGEELPAADYTLAVLGTGCDRGVVFYSGIAGWIDGKPQGAPGHQPWCVIYPSGRLRDWTLGWFDDESEWAAAVHAPVPRKPVPVDIVTFTDFRSDGGYVSFGKWHEGYPSATVFSDDGVYDAQLGLWFSGVLPWAITRFSLRRWHARRNWDRYARIRKREIEWPRSARFGPRSLCLYT